MLSTIRRPYFVLIPALIVAFGCTSTTPAPEPVEKPETPAAEQTSKVEVSDASAMLEPVYFDTDRAVLKPGAREKLDGYAKAILEHPEWGVVRIDGHCDERGSDAYNLALGQRRAAAIERYLAERGVPGTRLATKTFGSQRPAVSGHDESAWRFNRRSELRTEQVLASTGR